MFRMWFTCIKGSLWRSPLCIAGPWLVITVKPLCVSLRFTALKPSGRCSQNANNADIVTSSSVIGHCWWLFVKHICMEWLLRIRSLIPFHLGWRICWPWHKFHTGFCVNHAWMHISIAGWLLPYYRMTAYRRKSEISMQYFTWFHCVVW